MGDRVSDFEKGSDGNEPGQGLRVGRAELTTAETQARAGLDSESFARGCVYCLPRVQKLAPGILEVPLI